MKRHFPGLHQDVRIPPVPEGWFWVRTERAVYVRRGVKSYYQLRFRVLEPAALVQSHFHGRLYATPKALWKLLWFLETFHYDAELLHRDEIDDRKMVGLSGLVRVSHARIGSQTFLNLDGFESENRWPEFRPLSEAS